MNVERQVSGFAVISAIAVLAALYPASVETAAADAGAAVYARSCIACHGVDGAGAMPGIPDLTDRQGPLAKPEDVLLRSILDGIASGASPTPMPPKGGDEGLTEAEARMVLNYMRHRFSE